MRLKTARRWIHCDSRSWLAAPRLNPSNFARTKRNWCALNPSATLPDTRTKRTVNYREPLFSARKRSRQANEFSRQINLRQQRNYHCTLGVERSRQRWRISQVENHSGCVDIMSFIFDKSAPFGSGILNNRVFFMKEMNNKYHYFHAIR